jgi:hypothetical protein
MASQGAVRDLLDLARINAQQRNRVAAHCAVRDRRIFDPTEQRGAVAKRADSGRFYQQLEEEPRR